MSRSAPAAYRDAPTIAAVVRAHARTRPDAPAFIEPARTIGWAAYDALSSRLALRFCEAGLEPGERIGIWLPEGIEQQLALLAAQKAGLVAVGIGSRAGLRELGHLLGVAGAAALLCAPEHRGHDMAKAVAGLRHGLPCLREYLPLETGWATGTPADPVDEGALAGRALGTADLFLLNSTSGTTGMPKCVMHDLDRWYAFHDAAVEAGALSAADVFLGAAPPPFGFGLWTTHITPALLGAPVVLLPRFDAAEALAMLERHRVTVLAAVSTQFVLMLDSPRLATTDFGSLRAMFTGGERVPFERALDFERRTGAAVLQFYGSNEAGGVSRTTLDDPQEMRLGTAGRISPDMELRLFDEEGRDVTAGGRGQPGVRGPMVGRGYFGDAAANARLFTDQGFMLLEDVVELDAAGYLRVVGRKGDFVIRGGKNISCAAVEQAAGAHPAVALAAAVGVPDPVLGERVMLFAVLQEGASLTLEGLKAFLDARQVSREIFPEYLEIRAALPRSSGDKVAKAELRAEGRRIVEATAAAPAR